MAVEPVGTKRFATNMLELIAGIIYLIYIETFASCYFL